MVKKGSVIKLYLLEVKTVGEKVCCRFVRASSPGNAIISAARVLSEKYVESVFVYDGSLRSCSVLAELNKISLY